MIDTMEKTHTYIEYFHYDGRNQIDGFITPDLTNMVTVNNDNGLRKKICDQLFEKYPLDAFKFNQGLTSIAVNIFKQLYGHIPKSNYNRYVTTTIDDHYPKALQHTFHKEFDSEETTDEVYETVALDIAKDYPSVLLTNKHDIPLYGIYNTITKFDGSLKTGEYYINETRSSWVSFIIGVALFLCRTSSLFTLSSAVSALILSLDAHLNCYNLLSHSLILSCNILSLSHSWLYRLLLPLFFSSFFIFFPPLCQLNFPLHHCFLQKLLSLSLSISTEPFRFLVCGFCLPSFSLHFQSLFLVLWSYQKV